jgi:quinol monooxygenase YgiN
VTDTHLDEPPPAGFGLVVRFTLRPGAEAAFDALVARTLDGIREREPGTLVYAVHATPSPSERVFYELYADRAAFDAHEAQPHTRVFLAEREQHLAGVEVTFLTARAVEGSWTGLRGSGH